MDETFNPALSSTPKNCRRSYQIATSYQHQFSTESRQQTIKPTAFKNPKKPLRKKKFKPDRASLLDVRKLKNLFTY